jgi:hypothetical protein
LTQDYLWMRTLSSNTSKTSTRKDQLSAVNKQFRIASEASTSAVAAAAPIVSTSTMGGVAGGGSSSSGGMGAATATAASTGSRGGGGLSTSATRSGKGPSGAYSQVRAEQGFAAMAVGVGGGPKKSSSSSSAAAAAATNPRTVELHKAVDQLAAVALEEMCEQTLQRAKIQVFGGSMM